ncbi:hypothetical protein [Ileibacterium valens]|uniref:hypothetical protein n=1 Tax=Ileibacterium valens TaxID=1862668 RepID=UPI00272F5EA4|nr:hypothetical protein [Ileibacterium valens]
MDRFFLFLSQAKEMMKRQKQWIQGIRIAQSLVKECSNHFIDWNMDQNSVPKAACSLHTV